MRTHRAPRRAAWIAVAVVLTAYVLGTVPARASQPEPPCYHQDQSPEFYGPTDINAETGNQGLSVALNGAGTVTVFRWPRPSFYDQVKYRTDRRDLPAYGVLPNEGAFLGLAVTTAEGTATSWLRNWASSQQYGGRFTDAVITDYRSDALGLSVQVTDVVARGGDVLVRRVTVGRDLTSPVTGASLVTFENMNLVVSKYAQLPIQDWCQEGDNTDQAVYEQALDAIVHTKSGVDRSTGLPSSAAVAMAFAGRSSAHQVGGDAYEPSAAPDGKLPGPTQDAYDDAADGTLNGGNAYVGQTTGALVRGLDLSRGKASETVLFTAAPDAAHAGALVERARRQSFGSILREKRAWFRRLLRRAPMPASSDPAIRALAERALVTLVDNYDPVSGAIVASIATQSPYGEDWIRDGSFFDHALNLIGLGSWVDRRVRWYASLQQSAENPHPDAPLTPPGNWGMNYYADGIVGGPIPFEIDETGFGLWTMWDRYRFAHEQTLLAEVYPAIRRAADFLVACVDPFTGLQCPANEDDNPQPTQSNVGAGPVWVGLDSAAKAATVLGETVDAARYRARRDQLGAAIDAHLWDPGAGEWAGAGDRVMAWPVCFRAYDDPRMKSHLEAVWAGIAPTFDEPAAGARTLGAYEAKGLVALAKAWKGDAGRMERVRRGLAWISGVEATPGTHIEGESWQLRDGRVITFVSQPHTWEQILFYLAALEAYPPPAARGAPATCDGVIGTLAGLDPAEAPGP